MDVQFEKSLAVFGLNKKRESKSQWRDERKRAKTSKVLRKEHDDEESVFSVRLWKPFKVEGN